MEISTISLSNSDFINTTVISGATTKVIDHRCVSLFLIAAVALPLNHFCGWPYGWTQGTFLIMFLSPPGGMVARITLRAS
jgi:hypothetical protein